MRARISDADGGHVEYAEVDGKFGHLNGLVRIGSVGDKISAFLAE